MFNPRSNNTISLVDSAGNVLLDAQCASALNEVFVHSFSRTTNKTGNHIKPFDVIVKSPIIIDHNGVVKAIKNLKASSSPG